MPEPNPELDRYFHQVNHGRENRFFLALFLIAMLGGAIRKWFTTSGSVGNAVLFVQMMVPFAMFIMRSASAVSPFQKFPILYLFFGYLAFHIIYPLQVTPYHGILGMLVHGLFWMGAFFYVANRRLFNPAHYLPLIFIMVGGEIFLAFIQYALPADNFLNKYAHDAVKSVAVVDGKVRISGTFSYLSGFTAFLLFYPFFTWALIRKRYSTWIVAFAAGFGLVASFMSGSRSGAALYVAFTSVLLVQSYKLSDLFKILGRLIIPGMIGLMIILLSKKIPIADQIAIAYDNFSSRVTQNRARGEERKRILGDLYFFENSYLFKYPILGIGVGATYQGAIILFGVSPYAQEFGYVESEFIKVLLEGGVILLFFKIALASILVMQLAFPSKMLKALTWISLVYAAPIVYNVHNAAFLLLGIMLVDNIVWRQEVEDRFKRDIAPLKESEEEEVVLSKGA